MQNCSSKKGMLKSMVNKDGKGGPGKLMTPFQSLADVVKVGSKGVVKSLGNGLKKLMPKVQKTDPNPSMGFNSNVSRNEAQKFASQNPAYQTSLKNKKSK
jgi:hypothetical protein